ncbi:MAG: DUF1622 domain-containing protein [Leptolyngbyaceae cyanobacterium RM2_2_4]|nr:DUF1622 domain-containing protein [Leptolyngbyaceae cyanobacterium SM1_4_3]NJO53028.1 DUF1622 domain-containing protein [Leptolyngbyaceae cyanobacterium RM2_2_4]NJO67274.1 DUF1622 domain-containing protein [Leptolyngbyaceae cyanobacterium RM1_405_57]
MIELLEGGLEGAVELLRFSMEAIAAFCIFVGLVTSVLAAVRHPQRTMESNFLLLRLRLGSWLALALEFQLGADILSTIVAPTFEELGKLAVIALIRTFLNYFLSRELAEEEKRESQLRALKETMKPNH